MSVLPARRGRDLGAIALYAAAYGGSLWVLSREPGFEAGESVGILLVFGLGLSLVAGFLTRKVVPARVEIRRPALESLAVLGYLAIFAVLMLGYGFTALHYVLPAGRMLETALLVTKLATMVVLPVALVRSFGYRGAEACCVPPGAGRAPWLSARLAGPLAILCLLMLGLQATVGRGPAEVAALAQEWHAPVWKIAVAWPLAWAWMSLEAGLTEEYLFRVFLQTRLAAWLRSEVAAVLAMSVVFGLAHAPGYVLRGAHLVEGMQSAPGPLMAAAYAIAVVSPVGILFGVLWSRTRSLGFLLLLHGFADSIPNLAPFVRTWFG